PGEFWRKILALTNLLFYSLALGMLVSSFMRNERAAAGVTLLLLLAAIFLPNNLIDLYQARTKTSVEPWWLVLPDVKSPMRFASDATFTRSVTPYWKSLAVTH